MSGGNWRFLARAASVAGVYPANIGESSSYLVSRYLFGVASMDDMVYMFGGHGFGAGTDGTGKKIEYININININMNLNYVYSVEMEKKKEVVHFIQV